MSKQLVPTHLLVAAAIAWLPACDSDDGGSQSEFLVGYLAFDPCTATRDAQACGAIDGCGWHALDVACPPSTDCPEGFCASDDPCRDHGDASACTDDAACAWANRDRLCLGNHDCEAADGFCYAHSLGDGDCACLCPLYCPSGDCPGCECDCAVMKHHEQQGPGGSCSCACEPCGPGEICAPCACDCAGSTAPGDGGCVGDATCTCACETCPADQPCAACDCECQAEDTGSTASTCECAACPDATDCAPCDCGGEACGVHGSEADCTTDAADCTWVPVNMGCGGMMGMGGCHEGVCRDRGPAMDDCTCACEGAQCSCDCSQFDRCTPPMG
jgi:hypothetical protein